MLAPIRTLTMSSRNGVSKRRRQPLRDERRPGGIGVEQHDRELVAAEPHQQIVGARQL